MKTYGLFGTIDMLKISAGALSRATHLLGMLQGVPMGLERSHSAELADEPLIEDTRQLVQKHLRNLRPELVSLSLPMTIACADRLDRQTRERKDFQYGDLWSLCEQIESRLFDELATRNVYVLDARHSDYFTESNFGGNVSDQFPSAAFDIDEALKCLALGRSTACAFHLMRVLELALRAIHQCLAIPVALVGNDRNWGNVVNRIREELKRRGKTFAEAETFLELHALLDSVKDAWRNPTLHVEAKKTEEEAEVILTTVRGFMRKLAARMDEQGLPLA